MNKKIGPVLLSGLMIGPILGSGIILLPPMAYNSIGSWSLLAWIIILILGVFFAMCFSKLSILKPGDGGMTNAIEETMGKKWKLFSSLAMISAVLAGPTAVMLTASSYLVKVSPLTFIPESIMAIILVLLAFILLLRELKVVSMISFIVSSLIAIILIVSSLMIVFDKGIVIQSQNISVMDFGKCILLLFWAIIGWEVVGNYTGQVRNVKKDISIATSISAIIISLTYMLVAIAINNVGIKNVSLVEVISPIFASSSSTVLAVLITGLCLTTYLLIVGAVGRLIRSLSEEKYLEKIFSNNTRTGIPYISIAVLSCIHILVLIMNYFNILSIDVIVNWANGFFIGNAIIGLIATYKISDDLILKISSVFLIVCLTVLLAFSSLFSIAGLIVVYFLAERFERKREVIAE
jgi:APA family basic amino acid/polyamine antiporter